MFNLWFLVSFKKPGIIPEAGDTVTAIGYRWLSGIAQLKIQRRLRARRQTWKLCLKKKSAEKP
jgi:hypothetical protein